jgi:hypothetical protein
MIFKKKAVLHGFSLKNRRTCSDFSPRQPTGLLNKSNVSQFKGVLELLAPLVIREIRKDRDMTEEEAFTILYSSFLYSKLEVESTKLWHLSPCALLQLLNQELETGNIIFPEEA